MPTGYTHPVAEGEVTELKDFAALTARGMMPFIHMRDTGLGAELHYPGDPDSQDSYYRKSLVEAEERLKVWLSLNEEEKYAKWSEEVTKNQEYNAQIIEDKQLKKQRYQGMLDQLIDTKVPSKVQSFKDYMMEQLEESMRFDCNYDYYIEQEPTPFFEWCDKQEPKIRKDIGYYHKQLGEEQERYAGQCELIRLYSQTFGFEVKKYD